MTLREILESANEQSDENYDIDTLADIFNDAIANINADLPALFPMIDPDVDLDNEYKVHNENLVTSVTKQNTVNDTFLRNVVKPFIIYMIKVKEDEEDSAAVYSSQYRRNLAGFARTMRHVIDPDFFVEIDESIYDMNSAVKEHRTVAKGYQYGGEWTGWDK